MPCSPAEGLTQCWLLQRFSAFVTNMLSGHISCMWQGFPSPLAECNPVLPSGEDVENDRMKANVTVSQWYLWLQILLALCKWTILSTYGGPLMWLSIYHCRVKHPAMPATEISGISTEAPAMWVMRYLLGHPWTMLILLYKLHVVVNFYCSVHLNGYKGLIFVFISI